MYAYHKIVFEVSVRECKSPFKYILKTSKIYLIFCVEKLKK